jgi:hypothetical protein
MTADFRGYLQAIISSGAQGHADVSLWSGLVAASQ